MKDVESVSIQLILESLFQQGLIYQRDNIMVNGFNPANSGISFSTIKNRQYFISLEWVSIQLILESLFQQRS